MINNYFSLSGSPHNRIFNNENPNSAASPAPIQPSFPLTGYVSNAAQGSKLYLPLLPSTIAADGLWNIGKAGVSLVPKIGNALKIPQITNWTKEKIFNTISGSADTAYQGTAGGIEEVAVKMPFHVAAGTAKSAFKAMPTTWEGGKAALGTVIDAPGAAVGAIVDTIGLIRNKLMLNSAWNNTFGALTGWQVKEKVETERTKKWFKERWGKFGNKFKDFSGEVLKTGVSVADGYTRWGQRVWNSSGIKSLRDIGGGQASSQAPAMDFLRKNQFMKADDYDQSAAA